MRGSIGGNFSKQRGMSKFSAGGGTPQWRKSSSANVPITRKLTGGNIKLYVEKIWVSLGCTQHKLSSPKCLQTFNHYIQIQTLNIKPHEAKAGKTFFIYNVFD